MRDFGRQGVSIPTGHGAVNALEGHREKCGGMPAANPEGDVRGLAFAAVTLQYVDQGASNAPHDVSRLASPPAAIRLEVDERPATAARPAAAHRRRPVRNVPPYLLGRNTLSACGF
jgi:hypothetical protein